MRSGEGFVFKANFPADCSLALVRRFVGPIAPDTVFLVGLRLPTTFSFEQLRQHGLYRLFRHLLLRLRTRLGRLSAPISPLPSSSRPNRQSELTAEFRHL